MNPSQIVCVNLTPDLCNLELVQLTPSLDGVGKSHAVPLMGFDGVNRQIVSISAIGDSLRQLYDHCRIPLKTPAVLVLPSYLSREITLPSEFSEEELRYALTSEAERYYIFKKVEPMVAWIPLEPQRLYYAAFPKPEIEQWAEAFQEVGIPLLQIDLNYLCLMRGLIHTGALAQQVSENTDWGLVFVSDFNFFIATGTGKDLRACLEIPMAKEVSNVFELMTDILQDFERMTESLSLQKLFLINANPDRIPSAALMARLTVPGQRFVIEQTAQTVGSLGADKPVYPCTLEGIGGCTHFAPKMNFAPTTGVDQIGLIQTRSKLLPVMLMVNAACLGLTALVWLVLSWQIGQIESEVNRLTEQMPKTSEIQGYQELRKGVFTKGAFNQNKLINDMIITLGEALPPQTWLESVTLKVTHVDKPPQIHINGSTLEADPLSGFLNKLKKNFALDTLEVSQVEPHETEAGEAFFTWQLQNSLPSGEQTPP